jgi:hypothetical protein
MMKSMSDKSPLDLDYPALPGGWFHHFEGNIAIDRGVPTEAMFENLLVCRGGFGSHGFLCG